MGAGYYKTRYVKHHRACGASGFDSGILLTGKEDKNDIVYIPVYEEKKKINRKKLALLICAAFIVVFAGSFIYWGSNLPVSYDAGACGGGFSAHIFAKYSEELSEMYLDSLDDKELIENYTVIKESDDISWAEDVITIHFDVSYDHSLYGNMTQRIGFFGKRYWFEKYKWSSPIVVG